MADMKLILFQLIQQTAPQPSLKHKMIRQFIKDLKFVPKYLETNMEHLFFLNFMEEFLDSSEFPINIFLSLVCAQFPTHSLSQTQVFVRMTTVWEKVFSYAWYANSIRNFDTLNTFIRSDFWRMQLTAFVLFEIICNFDHEILLVYHQVYQVEMYKFYCQLFKNMVFFIFDSLLKVTREKRAPILDILERDLLLAMMQIEEVCLHWKSMQFRSQQKGPYRVALLTSFYSLVLFSKYFLLDKEDLVAYVSGEPVSPQTRADFLQAINLNESDRRAWYRKLSNVQMFDFKRETMLYIDFHKLTGLELWASMDLHRKLMWKCLIELDPLAKQVLIERVCEFLEELTTDVGSSEGIKAVLHILNFVHDVFISETVFESLLIPKRLFEKCSYTREKKIVKIYSETLRA